MKWFWQKKAKVEVNTLTEPTFRVEAGPAYKTAVATPELLDDHVTASHYKVGQKDAMGKTIVLGERITYLDYKGVDVWYIYKLGKERWDAVGVESTEERAWEKVREWGT